MADDMDVLMAELKTGIVTTLGLDDVTPEEIENDAPLFVEGLGLDSIDALELVVVLEKQYGIVLKDMETSKNAFASIRTMAEFVVENRPKVDG